MIWRASPTDKTAISRRHPKHIMEHHITVSTFIPIFHGFYQQIAGTPLIWIVVLAPPGAILFLSFSHREDQRRRTPGHVLQFCGILGPPHGVDRHRDAHPGEAKALAAYRALARWDFPG